MVVCFFSKAKGNLKNLNLPVSFERLIGGSDLIAARSLADVSSFPDLKIADC